jgi:hypothetical protein
VQLGIAKAIQKDRFSPGFSQAEAAQRSAFARFNEESALLSSLVIPWDTTVTNVKIGQSFYSAKQIIYLAPESANLPIQVTPTQPDATASQNETALAAGLNNLNFTVTSADGLHTSQQLVQVYLLTNRNTRATFQYETNTTKMHLTSAKALKAVAALLQSGKRIELTFGMSTSASKSQSEAKIKQILASLKSAGVSPSKVTKVYLPGSSQAIKVSANYQN